MEIIKVEREALVLDEKEKERLKECLRYCKHRQEKHPDSGISGCHGLYKFITYMLENLK